MARNLLKGNRMRRVITLLVGLAIASTVVVRDAAARDPGDPIVLTWLEGDVAGQTPISDPKGGKPIGVVMYHQHRRGDLLDCTRVSRFADGSSDEDTAVARVGRTLATVSGRSIIRDRSGHAIVDLRIDVAKGTLTGFYQDDDGRRHDVDEHETLEPGTYWGPLIFLVVKNFDANVDGDRVRFRTVAPTPKPRVLTMELVHTGAERIRRMGDDVAVEQYTLRPTMGFLLDPIVHRLAPATEFLVEPGKPPGLARYAGPRNFQREEIRLQ